MTPSLSPTCVSCGTLWRNRAWGPPDRELTLFTSPSRQASGKKTEQAAARGLLSPSRKMQVSERLFVQRNLLKPPELPSGQEQSSQFGRRYSLFGLFTTFLQFSALTGTTLIPPLSFITRILEVDTSSPIKNCAILYSRCLACKCSLR